MQLSVGMTAAAPAILALAIAYGVLPLGVAMILAVVFRYGVLGSHLFARLKPSQRPDYRPILSLIFVVILTVVTDQYLIQSLLPFAIHARIAFEPASYLFRPMLAQRRQRGIPHSRCSATCATAVTQQSMARLLTPTSQRLKSRGRFQQMAKTLCCTTTRGGAWALLLEKLKPHLRNLQLALPLYIGFCCRGCFLATPWTLPFTASSPQ